MAPAAGGGTPMTAGGETGGRLLVVDDNKVNRLLLQRAIETLGHDTVPAANGGEALDLLGSEQFDAVLLDVEMPVLDGYETLKRIKDDPGTAHVPVIMVSGVDEVDSVVRCIELGAVDYLPKPFNAAVLRARIGAALGAKRQRDHELDLFAQIGLLVEAAEAVEAGGFDPSTLEGVAARTDQIGGLGRVFRTMAREVVEREQRLRRQIAQLEADAAGATDDAGSSVVARLASFVPFDRCAALIQGTELATEPHGAVLLADVSGFTASVAARSRELGSDRGAEELLRDLNHLYHQLVQAVHRHGGSVVGFAGDGITSWFDDRGGTVDAAAAAVAAGLELQALTADSDVFSGLKAAVAAGTARRLVVGDRSAQLLDVLAGRPVSDVAALEQRARPGELLVTPEVATHLADRAELAEPRRDVVVVRALAPADAAAWPPLDLDSIGPDILRPWLISDVFDQIVAGHGGFLAELREATALFVSLDELQVGDDGSASHLDDVVRWIQQVLVRHHGTLMQLTPTESSGYFYACFGTPRAIANDADAALAAAAELRVPPPGMALAAPRIGLARGAMRVGAYGGAEHRTYGAIGEQTNLAARLMQIAAAGEVLVDPSIATVTSRRDDLDPAGTRDLKGVSEPVPVHRLATGDPHRLDEMAPTLAATVKVASIFTDDFDEELLAALTAADDADVIDLREPLTELCERGVLTPSGTGFAFADPAVRSQAYNRLLYSQRRRLHRSALDHLARRGQPEGVGTIDWFRALAEHAAQAEDTERATTYLEQAAAAATGQGRTSEALALLEASLRIERGDARSRKGD